MPAWLIKNRKNNNYKNLCLFDYRIIFFLAVALTSGAMLIERNEGILERSLVSGKSYLINIMIQIRQFHNIIILHTININIGITGIEVLLGHVVCQLLIMVFQSLMVIAFALVVFDVTNEGDVFWISLLTILTGLCGMCFGQYTYTYKVITSINNNYSYLIQINNFVELLILFKLIQSYTKLFISHIKKTKRNNCLSKH